MKRKKSRIRLLLASAAAMLALPGCGVVQGRTLKVGVKDDVANFGLYDEESGRYSGMEIDLAQTLCEDLGYGRLELTTVSASTREELIDSGELDMVIATYSITEDRKKKYDFSTPYYADYAAVMVQRSSMITKPEDLAGCRIGVLKSSSTARDLAKHLAESGVIPEFDETSFSTVSFDGGVDFLEYESYSAISDALEYGYIDAFAADHSILSGYINDERLVLPGRFAQQDYAICTKKDSALSEKVDEALQKRIGDGTLRGLLSKWGI